MRRIAVFIVVALAYADLNAMPPAEVFGTLPGIHDAAISPDGQQIAAIVNYEGEYGVRVMTIGDKDEEARAIFLSEGVKPEWIRWANNERVLVGLWQSTTFRRVPISTSFIYTLDSSKMEGKILVQARKILRQDNSDVIDFLDDDPDHILMGFSEKNQLIPDIRRVDINTGKYWKLKSGQNGIQNWFTDQRGEPRVGQGLYDHKTEENAWKLIIRDVDENKDRKSVV